MAAPAPAVNHGTLAVPEAPPATAAPDAAPISAASAAAPDASVAPVTPDPADGIRDDDAPTDATANAAAAAKAPSSARLRASASPSAPTGSSDRLVADALAALDAGVAAKSVLDENELAFALKAFHDCIT